MSKNHDTATGSSSSDGAALAVSYLRVSTKEEAEKGGMDEGYSILPSVTPTCERPR